MQAMALAVIDLCNSANLQSPDYVLVDGNRIPPGLPHVKAESVIKVNIC